MEHNNWEIPTALDFDAWRKSVQHILNDTPDDYVPCLSCPDDEKLVTIVDQVEPTMPTPNTSPLKVLILDGFLIFNDEWTSELCDLKFYFTLTREQCLQRRSLRNYDPPDIPGYFEACVWPEHVKWKGCAIEANPDMIVMDGFNDRVKNLDEMLKIIGGKCPK
jgi:uridine kinase